MKKGTDNYSVPFILLINNEADNASEDNENFAAKLYLPN